MAEIWNPDHTDRHLRRAMVLLGCAAVLFVVISVLQILTVRDGVRRTTHDLVEQNIIASQQDLQKSMELLVSDYSYWDEAFDTITQSLNPDWLHSNYGPDLTSSYQVSAVYLVYPRGPIRQFANDAIEDIDSSTPAAMTLIGSLRDLASQSRLITPNITGRPATSSGFLLIDGVLYVAATSELRPAVNVRVYDRESVPNVVFLRPLNTAWLEQLTSRLSLPHASLVRITPTETTVLLHTHDSMHPDNSPPLTHALFTNPKDLLKASVVFANPQGLEIARLEFVPPDMAPTLVSPTALIGIFASCALLLVGALLMRQMSRTSRVVAAQNERLHYEVTCRVAAEKELLRHQEHLEETVAQRNTALSREVERTHALLHDLENSLQRVQRIIDTSNEGFVHLDQAGRVIGINQEALRLLGYSATEMMGKSLEPILTPEGLAIFHEQMRLRSSTQFRSYTLTFHHKDGTPVQVDVMASSEFDNGSLSGSFAFFRDIRERLHQEETLKAAQLSAQTANQAKYAFLTRMSTELRTPLNAIMGFTQLLLTSTPPLPPRQRDQVVRVHQAGEALLCLVNETLDFSRIESGQVILKLENVAPAVILAECARLAGVLAEQMEVTIHLPGEEGDSLAPALVRADQSRLRQILLNLISNGIKYNRPGGTVTLSARPLNRQFYRLRIEDTGCGIPESLLPHLFEPFNRLGHENSSIEGTGIGLAISKKLVEAMGGRLLAEPQEQGMLFAVDLPLATSPSRTTPPSRTTNEASPALSGGVIVQARTPPAQVLIIEDTPGDRAFLQQVLGPYPSYHVHAASSCAQAVPLIEMAPPDLLIVSLPAETMAEEAVAQEIRSLLSLENCPLLALLPRTRGADLARLKQLGITASLGKPIQPLALLREIERLLSA